MDRKVMRTSGWTDQKSHAYELMNGSEKSCIRADGSDNSCVQTEDVQKPCGRKSSCVGVWKNDGVKIISKSQRNRMCQDAGVKPIVRDPMNDDKILVESGAEMTPVRHEPSQFKKLKHQITHIPFQLWCTSCVKSKAQAEQHKRTERTIEDSELPMIQCDYLMLKDVAGTGGLKVLSMYVRTFGYGMYSCRTERTNRHVRNNVGSKNEELTRTL